MNMREGQGYQVQYDPQNPKNKLSEYIGGWKADRRNGLGYKMSDNQTYRGQWLDHKPHGYGAMKVYENGRTVSFGQYNGVFKHGKMIQDLNSNPEEYQKLLKLVQKAPSMPKRLNMKAVPKIDSVFQKMEKTQESLPHLREQFLIVD